MNIINIEKSGRIDKVLAEALNVSRNQVEKLLCDGGVFLNDSSVTKRSLRVEKGDKISYQIKEAPKSKAMDIDFDLEILYEDEYLLVVNKPSGLVVHSAPSVKEATLVDWLIHKGISLSTISGEERHGIVHRIDKETTGALVVAKDNKTHEALSKQLQNKSMGRYYLALIDCPLKEDTLLNKPIRRHLKNRLKMAVLEGGREAKTAFKKLLTSSVGIELITAKLFTGRTHQIRVHLNYLGRHILGDELYGFKAKKAKMRVQLHAYLLYLKHPHTGKEMQFTAPLFEDMQINLLKYFKKAEIDEAINTHYFEHYFSAFK